MNKPIQPAPGRRVSAGLAGTAILSAMLAGFTLFFGLIATGGGHGTFGLWYLGLGLCWLAWLTCAGSLTVEIVNGARGFSPNWWIYVLLPLFAVGSLLGLWGLSG